MGSFFSAWTSADTLKRANLIHHFQGVILLFSRERTMCHCVLNSFKAHNVLFAPVTVSSSGTAWTFQKLAELTVSCALCLRTLAWPLTPKQAFWVPVWGVKAIFSFLPIPPFLHQHMSSVKLSALLPQSQEWSASYPGAAQFSSPAVFFPGFLGAGRRFQSGPASPAGEHLTLKYQNASKNISRAE